MLTTSETERLRKRQQDTKVQVLTFKQLGQGGRIGQRDAGSRERLAFGRHHPATTWTKRT